MAVSGRTHGSHSLGVLDGPAAHVTFVCGGTLSISRDRSRSHQIERRETLPRLQLQERVEGSSKTLVLTGELDRVSSVDLEARVLSLCRDGISLLVLDLRKLSFMDLYGLRTVLFAKEACAWHGCDFGLVPGSGDVQRVFEPSNRLDIPAASIPGGEALLSWSAPVL
jgi:anti-anti-sigma factor